MDNIRYDFIVEKDDFERAGEASSNIKKVLRQLGLNSGIIRRVSIAAYEAEINLVIHSNGGTLGIEIDPEKITIYANDKGPGIKNVALAMKEGYSTASDRIREMGFGAGMGLPNMKKCSDDFYIDSVLDRGTSITIKIFLKDGD
ncbi:MAG: anti-sigma regulatory factor [Clostridiales bacterium]|jgi:serine/threonine-protein kinase RsbT|nr:anti-sigma regulatory factor [Clostridiales bacterium]